MQRGEVTNPFFFRHDISTLRCIRRGLRGCGSPLARHPQPMKTLFVTLVLLCLATLAEAGDYRYRAKLVNQGKFPSQVTAYTFTIDPEDFEAPWIYTEIGTFTVAANGEYTFDHDTDDGGYEDNRITFTQTVDAQASGASLVLGPNPLGTGIGFCEDGGYQITPARTTVTFIGRGLYDDEVKPVWILGGSGTEETEFESTAPLTNGVFREGIDKLLISGTSSPGGGSGGSVDTDAINDFATDQQTLKAATPSDVTISDNATAGRTLLTNAMNNSTVSFVSGNHTATGGALSAGMWLATIPIGQTDTGSAAVEMNLNPLANSDIAAIAEWFKTIVTVLVFILFEAWVWHQFSSQFANTLLTPQNRGNAVLGGTGGQATSLVATTIIGIIILGLPALAWAVYSGGLSALGGPTGAIDWMPATNDKFGQAWYLLNAVIPTGTILIVWASVVIVRKAGFVIFTAAQFAVRAVTP